MYYGDKQDSLVSLMIGLANREWKIYGFKEDRSDSQSDYFDPARWEGIAVKNGFILVVDCYSGGKIGGNFIRESYDSKVANRIKKLQTLADNHAASKGERDNALAMIEKFDKDLVKTVTIAGELPEVTYQKNPGNSKWHIEKDGKIVAKGTGVYSFGRLDFRRNGQVRYKKIENNLPSFLEYFNFDGSQEKWEEHYEYIADNRKKETKAFDKYFKLLDKWEKLAAIKLGDGEEETLVQTTITKKVVHLIAEISETPTDYVQIGEKWRRVCGLQQGYIYKLSGDKKTIRKLTRKWVTLQNSKSISSYKAEPNKSTKPTSFFGDETSHLDGKFVYISLVEVVEFVDEVTYIKKAKVKTAVSLKKETEVANKVLYSKDELDTFTTGVLFA